MHLTALWAWTICHLFMSISVCNQFLSTCFSFHTIFSGYRCPSHAGVASSANTNAPSTDSVSVAPPRYVLFQFHFIAFRNYRNYLKMYPLCRTKHVSFARSHTLTSFEDLTVDPSVSRLNATKSQERLIGGKKARNSPEYLHQQLHLAHRHSHERGKAQEIPTKNVSILKPDPEMIEKQKRNVKKTQATQTEVVASRRMSFSSNLSMSPHSAQRVFVNGNLAGRTLTKSFSEATKTHEQPMINM